MQFKRYRPNIFRGWTWMDSKTFRSGPLPYNYLFFSRFRLFSRSWHSFCTNSSFGNEKSVDGWENSINFFYKKQTFLSSNDHIIFMTKYGCLSYEHEWTKVFYPLFKSFLPPSSMFFPTIVHIPSSKIQNGNIRRILIKFSFYFINVQEWVKNF